MAKELPYFRFTASEWLNDDISIESYAHKGAFIDFCAYYWSQDCDVTLEKLKKKFSNATSLLKDLISIGIIKHESKHDKIKIDFLMTQYDLLSEKRKLRQSAGSKGGNAKAMLKQKGSYKDKDKDNNKDKIEARKLIFKNELKVYLNNPYPLETIKAFSDYWTEPNKSKTKMKFELQDTWDLNLRLQRWGSKDNVFKKEAVTPKVNML